MSPESPTITLPLVIIVGFFVVLLLWRLFRANRRYNKAVDIHQQLRHMTNNPEEFARAAIEIISLCQLDIQSMPRNGDSYVLMASAYSSLAEMFNETKIFNYCLPRAFAVIKYWKTTPMHTRNRANGEVVLDGISSRVGSVSNHPGIPSDTKHELFLIEQDMVPGQYREILDNALDPNTIGELTYVVQSEIVGLYAIGFIQENLFDEAIDACNEFLANYPDCDRLLYARSLARIHKKQWGQALDDVNRAIELGPIRGYKHATRGEIYFAYADFDRALSDLNRGLQLEPNLQPARLYRAAVHVHIGNLDAAIADMREYYSMQIDGFSYENEASVDEAVKGTAVILDLERAGWVRKQAQSIAQSVRTRVRSEEHGIMMLANNTVLEYRSQIEETDEST